MDDTELVHTQGQGRERRRRRRPSSSYQEERASSLSREENASPTANTSSDRKDGQVGNADLPTRRRKTRRKENHDTGDNERVINGTHHPPRNGKDRPRHRKDSHSKRMPRSVSEEVLAMEGKFPNEGAVEQETNRPRRTRRRDPTHQTMEQGHEDSGTASGDYHPAEKTQAKSRPRQQPPRKKKKVRSAFITSGEEDNYQADVDGEVSEIFKVDKEDIAAYDAIQSPNRVHTLSAPTLPSQPLDYLFIEKKDGQGFVKEHKTKLARVEEEADYAKEMMDMHRRNTSIDLALQIHMAFRTFTLFCHGLLAGMALVQCIFVYTLSDVSTMNFLNNYYTLARPFQSMYYFLMAVCTVSVFDRFANVSSGFRQFFLSLLTYPSRALALLVYLIGFLFSLGLVQLDDRISLYKEDPSLWSSLGKVSTWKILNMFRVAGAIAGWMFVSLGPVNDQTAKHLSSIADQEANETPLEKGPTLFSV